MADRYVYDEDFEEEEIWATVGDVNESSKSETSKDSCHTFSAAAAAASRKVFKANAEASGRALGQSTPIIIPRQGQTFGANGNEESTYGDTDDEDGIKMAPPHTWLAKKMARSQTSCFSVCEGAGRTLKGRDLRKVRNAVLARTGFLE
ncbi:hypothetical protein Cni_G13659 [Canna indica]|uniref:Senescence regulator n=1 Tax=Canna indica TaxID=4628 RepID=A0AAQ3QCX0_9LILI|nr:hypothetical protein Cni_G13659 [Canna indica]